MSFSEDGATGYEAAFLNSSLFRNIWETLS